MPIFDITVVKELKLAIQAEDEKSAEKIALDLDLCGGNLYTEPNTWIDECREVTIENFYNELENVYVDNNDEFTVRQLLEQEAEDKALKEIAKEDGSQLKFEFWENLEDETY